MVVDLETVYPVGTVVKLFSSGLEGIIEGTGTDTLGRLMYYIEMRYGETIKAAQTLVAPVDHPIHDLLRKWNDQARTEGYTGLVIGIDSTGEWHRFFEGKGRSYGKIHRDNRHLTFMYYWRLRD